MCQISHTSKRHVSPTPSSPLVPSVSASSSSSARRSQSLRSSVGMTGETVEVDGCVLQLNHHSDGISLKRGDIRYSNILHCDKILLDYD